MIQIVTIAYSQWKIVCWNREAVDVALSVFSLDLQLLFVA